MNDRKPSIAERVERWVRPEVRALSAYHVPPAQGLVKLDAMENPYPWPGELTDQWLEALRGAHLNRYPDPGAGALKQALRDYMGVPEDMEVVPGNGSDELIQMLLLAVGGPGRRVMAPVPTFVMYEMIAACAGLGFTGVALGEDFALDAEAMCAAIRREQPAVVFLAYPNNPTGNRFDPGAVERVLEAADGLVVLDEAYHGFCTETFMDRLGQFDNLLVMRTVSKLGLAGLRLGLLAGPPVWMAQLEKVRLPYNINTLTQLSARFALAHREVLDAQLAAIRAERARLAAELDQRPGVTVFPSETNFVLFRVPGEARAVFEGLRRQGVLIKDLSAAGGALAGCLRVTVGTGEENGRFLAALDAVLG